VRIKELKGQTFGRLLALEPTDKRDSNGSVIWKCVCTCGTKVEVSSWALNDNSDVISKTQSCGCLNREHCAAVGRSQRKRPYEHTYLTLKRAAAFRKRTISLTFEEFLEFTYVRECHYCGAPITWTEYSTNKGGRHNQAYNLDRKDSVLGYTKDNCVVCCARCNYGKSDRFTYEEWVDMTSVLRPPKTPVNTFANQT